MCSFFFPPFWDMALFILVAKGLGGWELKNLMLLCYSHKLSSILLESQRMNIYGIPKLQHPYDIICGLLVHGTVKLVIHHKIFLAKTALPMPCLAWACTCLFQNLDVLDTLVHVLFSIHYFFLLTHV